MFKLIIIWVVLGFSRGLEMKKLILVDKKFKKNPFRYIFQCILAGLTILAFLFFSF